MKSTRELESREQTALCAASWLLELSLIFVKVLAFIKTSKTNYTPWAIVYYCVPLRGNMCHDAFTLRSDWFVDCVKALPAEKCLVHPRASILTIHMVVFWSPVIVVYPTQCFF